MAEETLEGTEVTEETAEVLGPAPDPRFEIRTGEDLREAYEAGISELGEQVRAALKVDNPTKSDEWIDLRVREAEDGFRFIEGIPGDETPGATIEKGKTVFGPRVLPVTEPIDPDEPAKRKAEYKETLDKAQESGELLRGLKDVMIGVTQPAFKEEITEGDLPDVPEFAEELAIVGAAGGSVLASRLKIPGGWIVGAMGGAAGGTALAHEIDDPGYLADLFNRTLDVTELSRAGNMAEELTAEGMAQAFEGARYVLKQKKVHMDGKTPEQADAEVEEWAKGVQEANMKIRSARQELVDTDPESATAMDNILAAGIPLARQIEAMESLPPSSVATVSPMQLPALLVTTALSSDEEREGVPALKSMAQLYREFHEKSNDFFERVAGASFMTPEERGAYYLERRVRTSEAKWSDAWAQLMETVRYAKENPDSNVSGILLDQMQNVSYVDVPGSLRQEYGGPTRMPDVRLFVHILQEATPEQRKTYESWARYDRNLGKAMNAAYGTSDWPWITETILDLAGDDVEDEVDLSEVQNWLNQVKFGTLVSMNFKFAESVPDTASVIETTGRMIERAAPTTKLEESVGSYMTTTVREGNQLYLIEGTMSRVMRSADLLMEPQLQLLMDAPVFAGDSLNQVLGVKDKNQELTLTGWMAESLANVATGDSGAMMATRRAMMANGGRPGEGYWMYGMLGGLSADFLVPWESPIFRTLGFGVRRSANALRGSVAAKRAVQALDGAPITSKLSMATHMMSAYVGPEIYQRVVKPPEEAALDPQKKEDLDAVSAVNNATMQLAAKMIELGISPLDSMSGYRLEAFENRLKETGVEDTEEFIKTFNNAMKGRRSLYTGNLQRFLQHGTPTEMSMRKDPEYLRVKDELSEYIKAGNLTDQDLVIHLALLEHQALAHSSDDMIPDIVTPIDFFKKINHRVGGQPGPGARFQTPEGVEPPARVEVLGQPVEAVTEVEGVSYRSRADRAREMRDEIIEMGHDVEELMRQDSGTLAGLEYIEPRVVNIDDIPVQKLWGSGRLKGAIEFIKSGKPMAPPRVAINADGTFHSIMDGRHRLEALRGMGKKKIVVDVELMERPADWLTSPRVEGARDPLPSLDPEVILKPPDKPPELPKAWPNYLLESASWVKNSLERAWNANRPEDLDVESGYGSIRQLIETATMGTRLSAETKYGRFEYTPWHAIRAIGGIFSQQVKMAERLVWSDLNNIERILQDLTQVPEGAVLKGIPEGAIDALRAALKDIEPLISDKGSLKKSHLLDREPWTIEDVYEGVIERFDQKNIRRSDLYGLIEGLKDTKTQLGLNAELHSIFQSDEWTSLFRGINREYQVRRGGLPIGSELSIEYKWVSPMAQALKRTVLRKASALTLANDEAVFDAYAKAEDRFESQTKGLSRYTGPERAVIKREKERKDRVQARIKADGIKKRVSTDVVSRAFNTPADFSRFMGLKDQELNDVDRAIYEEARELLTEIGSIKEYQEKILPAIKTFRQVAFGEARRLLDDIGDVFSDEFIDSLFKEFIEVDDTIDWKAVEARILQAGGAAEEALRLVDAVRDADSSDVSRALHRYNLIYRGLDSRVFWNGARPAIRTPMPIPPSIRADSNLKFRKAAKQWKSAKEAVYWIKENGTTDQIRAIAAYIEEFITDDVSIETTEAAHPEGWTGIYYWLGPGRPSPHIDLYQPNEKLRSGDWEKTALHELVHAATVMRYNEGLGEGPSTPLGKASIELDHLWEYVRDRLDGYLRQEERRETLGEEVDYLEQLIVDDEPVVRTLPYGLKNAKEFLAEAFSNPEFQSILKDIVFVDTQESVWSRLLSWVADALGIAKTDRNALSEAMRIQHDLLTAPREGEPSVAPPAGMVEPLPSKAPVPPKITRDLAEHEGAEFTDQDVEAFLDSKQTPIVPIGKKALAKYAKMPKAEREALPEQERRRIREAFRIEVLAAVPAPMAIKTRFKPRDSVKEKALPLNPTRRGDDVLAKIDALLERWPEGKMLSSEAEWKKFWFNATNDKNVVKPPYKMIEYYNNPDAVVDFLKENLTAEQQSAVNEGFSVVEKFGEAYAAGRAQPRHTAKLFLWGMLSRNSSVWIQEAGFIDAVNAGVDEFINVALRGEWDDVWQAAWRKRARAIVNLNKYSGSPGTQALMNLNAFGDLFLRRMSERLPVNHDRYPGMTKLEAIHRLMSDQNLSGSEVRRQFWTMSQGVGIQNKVMSFVALMAGRPDTAVLDVWQTRHIYDYANRANEYGNPGSLNTGWQAPKGGYKSTASFRPWSQKPGLASVFDGPRGLLFYEAVEGALNKIVPEVYKKLGRPEDASIGRFHWETWVAANQQLISHSTGEALVKEMFGLESPYRGVYVRMGEQRSPILGFYYVNVPKADLHALDPVHGNGILAAATSDGRIFGFDLKSKNKFEKEIKSHAKDVLKKLSPEERILPRQPEGEPTGKYLARLSQEAGGNWYEHPSVNRAAYDRAIERFGVQPDDTVLDVLADAFRIAPTEAKPALPTSIRYDGGPDSPRGSFEVRTDESGTASYLLRLFSTGRFDTLAHENGHLLQAIMGDKWRSWLFRFFDTDQNGRLTDAGHEQFANALAQWWETKRASYNPGVNRLIGQLHGELRNLWRLIRQKRHNLPKHLAEFWDELYRPSELLAMPAAKITDDVLKKTQKRPVVQLKRSVAGRVKKSIEGYVARTVSQADDKSGLTPLMKVFRLRDRQVAQRIASDIADTAIRKLMADSRVPVELPDDLIQGLMDGIISDVLKRLEGRDLRLRLEGGDEKLGPPLSADDFLKEVSKGIVSDVFTRLKNISPEMVPTAMAERVLESPVGKAGRRRAGMRLMGDEESLRQELGVKAGDEIDAIALVVRSMGLEAAERFKRSQRAENVVRMTIRTIVPASRVSRIKKDVTDRLMDAVGENAKQLVKRIKLVSRGDATGLVRSYMQEDPNARLLDEADYIEFDPPQAARIKRLVHELANEPMGNILPDRFFRQSDFTKIAVADWQNIHEVLVDVSAGVAARVNRYDDRMSRSLALAFTRYVGEVFDKVDNRALFKSIDNVRRKFRDLFIVPEFGKDLMDPAVRDLINNSLRLGEDNPRFFVRAVSEWRKGNKEGTVQELYDHLIEHLNAPVALSDLKPILEMERDLSGVISREDLRFKTQEELDIKIDQLDEGFDLQMLVRKLDNIQGYLTEYWGLHPKDRQALDIIRSYIDPTNPDRLVELSDNDRYAVSDAIRVIHNGLVRRKKQVLVRAENLAISLSGADDLSIVKNLDEYELISIYQNFYQGRFMEMINLAQEKGLIVSGYEYDAATAILEMIMRMRFMEILTVLSHNLAKYGYTGDVRELTSHRGFSPDTSIDRIAFVENVHHHINQIMSFNYQAIRKPEKRRLQTPRPKPPRQPDWRLTVNNDDLEAYTVAHKYVQKWGIKYAKSGFQQHTFPDGSTTLLPEAAIKEIEEMTNRLSQIGYAWTGAKSRKAQDIAAKGRLKATKKGLLGTELGPEFIPEDLGPTEKAKLTLAQAVDTVFELNPLTHSRMKQHMTTGTGLVELPYYMAAFMGIAAAVHQGLGAVKAGKITAQAVPTMARMGTSLVTKNSNLVGAVVSRMWGEGGWKPNARPLITKDYRVYTANRLGNMAIAHSLKSSFPQAESARAVHEILRDKLDTAPWYKSPTGFIKKVYRPWKETLLEFATAMDNIFRVSVWISEIERGLSPSQAAARARKIGMDYSALTEFEKSFMRIVFMFYSFQRKNLDLFYETLLTNPGRILAQMRLVKGSKNLWLEEEPVLVEEHYFESRPVMFAMKSVLNRMKNKQVAWYAPELPAFTAMMPFLNLFDAAAYHGTKQGDQGLREFISMTNPVLMLPIVTVTEQNFYFNRSLRRSGTIPSWFVNLDRYGPSGGYVVDELFGAEVWGPSDPEYQKVPGETVSYKAGGSLGPLLFHMWKNMAPLPFAGREMTLFDRLDRANMGAVESMLEVGYQFRQFGNREGFLDDIDSHYLPRHRRVRLPGTSTYIQAQPGTVAAETMVPRTELVAGEDPAAFSPGEAMGVIGIVPDVVETQETKIQRALRSSLRDLSKATVEKKRQAESAIDE